MPDWDALSARASFASHRLVGWVYWDPSAVAGYRALGLTIPGTDYIASRAAPLGPAGHQAVSAAFYSISPAFIELSLSMVTSFEALMEVRNAASCGGCATTHLRSATGWLPWLNRCGTRRTRCRHRGGCCSPRTGSAPDPQTQPYWSGRPGRITGSLDPAVEQTVVRAASPSLGRGPPHAL